MKQSKTLPPATQLAQMTLDKLRSLRYRMTSRGKLVVRNDAMRSTEDAIADAIADATAKASAEVAAEAALKAAAQETTERAAAATRYAVEQVKAE